MAIGPWLSLHIILFRQASTLVFTINLALAKYSKTLRQKTRTRSNTNPYDTEAIGVGRRGRTLSFMQKARGREQRGRNDV